jgi:hypothetical protein
VSQSDSNREAFSDGLMCSFSVSLGAKTKETDRRKTQDKNYHRMNAIGCNYKASSANMGYTIRCDTN